LKYALVTAGFLLLIVITAFSQGAPPITFQEADGSPRKTAPSKIIVSNGTLSCSGGTCTITTGGGSGSPGGSDTQLQYNNAGSFGGISGATTNGTAVTFTDENLRGANLRLTDTGTDTFTTPAGSSVQTKVNVVLYDPGNFGQIFALGLASGSASTARVLSLFDQRAASHQATLAMFSPNENEIFGFSWNGSNTTGQITNSAAGGYITITAANGVVPPIIAHANLPASDNGSIQYCTDCTVTGAGDNTCASGGGGAMAFRVNGAWRCFNLQN